MRVSWGLAVWLKQLKFVTFLPNVKEAENPFPGAPFPLYEYDMKNWFLVDDIIVFPVKHMSNFNFLSLPSSKIFKTPFSIYLQRM